MDKLTPEQRHRCMAAIKGKNTKPELLVRKFLFSHGFRYRLNSPRLPGHPDIVLRKYRTVIFINGCFWHGHQGCRHYVLPKSNTEYWKTKIERNRTRDAEVQTKLASMGWHFINIWECQLKPKVRQETLESLVNTLKYPFAWSFSLGRICNPSTKICNPSSVHKEIEKICYRISNANIQRVQSVRIAKSKRSDCKVKAFGLQIRTNSNEQ